MASERPTQVRLFVALDLPAEAKEALARAQEELRKLGAPRLRWVRPEGIHLTLKFLGYVPEARVAEIERALADAVEPFRIEVRLGPLGAFGGARLRVVWAGLQGEAGALAGLAGRIDAALAPLGFEREARPFAAHLTLARVPDETPADERRRLADLLRAAPPPRTRPIVLTELSLMRSTLRPDGAVYTRLAAFPAPGA